MDTRLSEIQAKLSDLTGEPTETITPTTRIYHDLGIAGGDFVELMDWFSSTYRVDTSGLDLSPLCPHELGGRRCQTYEPLTVEDLRALSSHDHWTDWSGAVRMRRLGGA